MRRLLKKKYIESHYTIFILKGIAATLVGAFLLFTTSTDFRLLSTIIGLALVIFGSSECINIIQRRKSNSSVLVPTIIMLLEIFTGWAILFPEIGSQLAPVVAILATYMVLRGTFEIATAIKNLTDKTDRFMWIAAGIIGVIIGIVALVYPAIDDFTFFKFVGTYFIVFGLTKLIFSVHRKSTLLAPKVTPATPAKKTVKAIKKPVAKKSAKKRK